MCSVFNLRDIHLVMTKKNSSTSTTTKLPTRATLPPFDALRAFDAVARIGGIRKAAIKLERNHAAVSRHIKTLEAWTDSVLFDRTPKGTQLTEEGKQYHKLIAGAINQIANATSDLMKRKNETRLNVWSMPGFALYWLTPHLKEFEAANPGLEIQIRPTNQSPDFLNHEADIHIRFVRDYGEKIKFTTGIKYMDLTRTKIIATASPEYISTHEKINKPKDLLGHYLLHEAHYEPWKEWLKAQGIQQDIEFTGPKLWQSHLTLDSARHGRGIALTNYLVVAEDLKKGDLLEVGAGLESFSIQNYGIYLFMTWASRWNETSIRRYRQWLKKTITTDLASIGTGSTK